MENLKTAGNCRKLPETEGKCPKLRERPGLGLSILVLNDKNQILLSQRLKSKNTMATPGGHIERFEELEETCQRELLEETGLSLKRYDFRYLFFKNIIRKDQDYHYMDFYYVCTYPTEQKVVNTEPESHTDWEWVDLETVFGKDLNWFYGMQEFIKEMKNKEECLERFNRALC